MRRDEFYRNNYNELIEWFVEKSTYVKRCSNDKENFFNWIIDPYYWDQIEELAKNKNMILREYSSKEELFRKLKTLKNGTLRPFGSVSHLIYIGHGYYYALALNINNSEQNIQYEEISSGVFFDKSYFKSHPRIELETCLSASISKKRATHYITISIAEMMSKIYDNSYVKGYDGRADFSGVPVGEYIKAGTSFDADVLQRGKAPSIKEFGVDDVSNNNSGKMRYFYNTNELYRRF